MDSVSNLEVTPELVELFSRYQRGMPRYTSYPTADRFSDEFSEQAFAERLQRSNALQIPAPLALYFHVPFCHSLCYYCGCNKLVTQKPGRAAPYLEALVGELDTFSGHLDTDRMADQIHFGGGTPNWLNLNQLGNLMVAIERRLMLDWSEDREFSIEIDPRYSDPEDMQKLAEIGFNRLSMGVQDFNLKVQQAVNRICEPAHIGELTDAARTTGIQSVSYDLIYGLPHQTEATFRATVNTVIEQAPDRVSLFLYAHLPSRFRAQRLLENHRPTLEQRLSIYLQTRRQLQAAGYRAIGMDHFARTDDGLATAAEAGRLHRSFQGYSTSAQHDLLGLGPSAISSVNSAYAQNAVKVMDWQNRVKKGLATVRGYRLSAKDRTRRGIIEQLMCYGSIDLAAVKGIEMLGGWEAVLAAASDELDALHADGLVEVEETRVSATPAGQLLIRAIARVFDSFLNPERSDRFSHAV